jgi:hypothetical protein
MKIIGIASQQGVGKHRSGVGLELRIDGECLWAQSDWPTCATIISRVHLQATALYDAVARRRKVDMEARPESAGLDLVLRMYGVIEVGQTRSTAKRWIGKPSVRLEG